jgi:hypothetical protein
MAWIAANWPNSGGHSGIAKNGDSRQVGRNLLEQFEPFSAQTIFE